MTTKSKIALMLAMLLFVLLIGTVSVIYSVVQGVQKMARQEAEEICECSRGAHE